MTADAVLNLIHRYLKNIKTHSSGIVVGYNPANHTCTVRMEPDGELTAPLPTLTSHPLYADSIPPGTPCELLMEYNPEEGLSHPVVVAGFHHNDNVPPPLAALVLGNDLHVSGNITQYSGYLQLGNGYSLPTPDASMRGRMMYVATAVEGQTGTADKVFVCLQSATGTLSWVQIATG
jgi:hypothetical protein